MSPQVTRDIHLCVLMGSLVLLNPRNLAEAIRSGPDQMPDALSPKSGCRILINEINVYNSAVPSQFIELSRYCNEVPKNLDPFKMTGFMLAFIDHKGYVVGSCKLHGEMRPTEERYWFYLIGTGLDADFLISECRLMQLPIWKQMDAYPFYRGIDFPVGLALLYQPNEDAFDNLQLDLITEGHLKGMYERKQLETNLEKLIMESIQDFYIYASSSAYTTCEYFKRFYSKYTPATAILRDYQEIDSGLDFTLSRCGTSNVAIITLPMQPELWVYANPSPKQKNNCESGFKFRAEDSFPPLKKPKLDGNGCYRVADFGELGLMGNPETFQKKLIDAKILSVAQSRIPSVDDTFVASDEQNEAQHPPNDPNDEICEVDLEDSTQEPPTTFSTTTAAFADQQVPLIPKSCRPRVPKVKRNPTSTVLFEASMERYLPIATGTCLSYINSQVQSQIANLDIVNLEDVLRKDVCYWFQILIPKKKFRCRLCHTLLIQNILIDRPQSSKYTYIMWDGVGTTKGKNRLNENRKLIEEHNKNPLHQISVHYFKLFDQGLRGMELKLAFESVDGPYNKFLNATMNYLTIVRQAVRMNISFRNYEKLADLMKHFNIPFGKLYHNREGMYTGLTTISKVYHQELISKILSPGVTLSIILDSSTDVSSNLLLAVLFLLHTPDGGVELKLYRLIRLKRETGQEVYDSLIAKFQEDGILEAVRGSLHAMGSDGAPNIYSTFYKLLKTFTGRHLFAIWCNCHRIDLILKNAFGKDKDEIVHKVDQVVNAYYTTFNSRSPLNKGILQETAQEENEKPFELKRIHPIRWVNGKYRALATLLDHWKTVTIAMSKVKNSKNFRLKEKSRADRILNELLDGTMIATLAFLTDMCRVFKELSLDLQRKGVTLIGKYALRVGLRNQVEALRNTNGKYLTMILDNSVVVSDPDTVMTLKVFETQSVKLYGQQLNSPNQIYEQSRLNVMRNKYIDNILGRINQYYPEDPQDLFDIMDPNAFPILDTLISSYGIREIKELNKALQWNLDDDILVTEWTSLIASVTKHKEFPGKKSLKPEEFWEIFLTMDVTWTPNLRKVISAAITTPASSSEAERIFGMMANTKTIRRYSMLPETLEAILRVNFNGETELEKFEAEKVTKMFLEEHSRSDDETRTDHWVSKQTLEKIAAAEEEGENDEAMEGDI